MQSARRMFGSPPATSSPLLRRRGSGRRFELVGFPLSRLRHAAKAAGGSINDAYLAGVCGVLRLYHDALGLEIGTRQKLREFDLTDPVVRAKMQERYGDRVPLNEPVISPGAMYDSPLLETIASR